MFIKQTSSQIFGSSSNYYVLSSFFNSILFLSQLNQQSHSESEVKEDDNETEAAKSCEGDAHESVKKKKKKKKKKSGKYVNAQKSSEDNADVTFTK